MVTRARLALYRSLSRARVRREEGLYLVEGRRLVTEAIDSGAPLATVLVTEEFVGTREGAGLAALAAETGIPVEAIPTKELQRIADTKTPQGVVGIVLARESEERRLGDEGLVLALDGVADPGNAGTLIRAADAFAARAILFGPGSADPFHPKTLRAAMGSSFHVPIYRTGVLHDDLDTMRAGGARVYAATLDGEDLYRVNTDWPCRVLVLGSEAHGVSRPVRDVADYEVTVPCPGRAESLNVAMAGAIALAHLAGRNTA